MPKVFLGMSGGVDSSVSALLLKQQGYDVTGIYMKNWSQDLPGLQCPWAEDLADAKRVAVQLDLDFEVWDFEAEYKQKVVDHMLAEFQRGRTPNPDVMCNQEIKFKLFYDQALARGADFIATGHYARTAPLDPKTKAASTTSPNQIPPATALLRAEDENKDQTYFLYRMSDEATARTLFPVGNLLKPAVKQLAAEYGLDVATKKESMGVCFVGEVGMKDFLKHYLETQPGEIREQETDQMLGYHEGAIFYTIGQRHGLYLGGGLPYYVVAKDLDQNIIYVSRNLNHPALWSATLRLADLHLRNHLTLADLAQLELTVRLRHRAPLLPAQLKSLTKATTSTKAQVVQSSELNHPQLSDSNNQEAVLSFAQPVKRPAAGQSVVFYDGKICLGGGIIY